MSYTVSYVPNVVYGVPLERSPGWWVVETDDSAVPGAQAKITSWLRGPYPTQDAALASMPHPYIAAMGIPPSS